jgi:hypothetical protein
VILQRIARYIRTHDWFAVVVEVVVVMAGLLMAFQLDRWWEQRDERRQEQAYIDRLITDVQTDIDLITYGMQLAEVREGFAELLMEVSRDPAAAAAEPVRFLAAVAQAPFTFTPTLISYTFEDLRATGNMRLLRSEEIKWGLYRYYGFDAAQRQFMPLNLQIEFRFFELAAGVLGDDQYNFVQDNWFVVRPDDLDELEEQPVDAAAVMAAVARYRSRPELMAWVSRVRGVQRELILMHGIRLNRAQELLELLRGQQEPAPAGPDPGAPASGT